MMRMKCFFVPASSLSFRSRGILLRTDPSYHKTLLCMELHPISAVPAYFLNPLWHELCNLEQICSQNYDGYEKNIDHAIFNENRHFLLCSFYLRRLYGVFLCSIARRQCRHYAYSTGYLDGSFNTIRRSDGRCRSGFITSDSGGFFRTKFYASQRHLR